MLYYKSVQETFAEVPNEISLTLGISGCKNNCVHCSSPWLQECGGIELTQESLSELIQKHPFCTCVTFLGGDTDYSTLKELLLLSLKSGKKTCFYSGKKSCPESLYQYLDYLKLGPYIESSGPLTSPTTNQKFYKVSCGKLIDQTELFWHKV